jgi:hypothetical protein
MIIDDYPLVSHFFMAKGISPEAFSAGTGVEAFTGTSNQETQVA